MLYTSPERQNNTTKRVVDSLESEFRHKKNYACMTYESREVVKTAVLKNRADNFLKE